MCAAVMLSRLLKKILESLDFDTDYILWSDSQIVLHWIHTSRHLLNVFVANRVSEIQNLTDISCWKYVNTKENPADLASRGVDAKILVNSELWWNGPSWLRLSISV